MDKVLYFMNRETNKRFYFLRLSSRTKLFGGKEVVAVGFEQHASALSHVPADELFGKDSPWEYQFSTIFEN